MNTNTNFKCGDVEVTIISTETGEGLYSVEIRAEGDKATVEAFMRDVVTGSADIDIPIEVTMGKVDGPMEPLNVSKLMGDN